MNQFKNLFGISSLKHWVAKVKNIAAMFILMSTAVSCGPVARSLMGESWGVKYAVNVGGYWSDWWQESFSSYGIYRSAGDMHTDGVSDYIIYSSGDLPSNYFLRIHINNYSKDMSNCDGYVEYYVSETYPTVESFFKTAYRFRGLLWFPEPGGVISENTVKRKAKARINVVKEYRGEPQVLNCWFDNVGLAIDLTMVYWKK